MTKNGLFPGFNENKKCGACANIRRQKFDGGTVLHYCSVKHGENDFGMMRVKCRDYGCDKWEVRR